MSSHKWRIERGKRAVVAKLLIAHINKKATGMLLKSEPLESYPSEGFTSVGMKPGVVCSVDRPLHSNE